LTERTLTAKKAAKKAVKKAAKCGNTCSFKPVPLETFVECKRHRGTSCKAANCVHFGKTVGRGKKSRVHEQILPVRDILLACRRRGRRLATRRSQ